MGPGQAWGARPPGTPEATKSVQTKVAPKSGLSPGQTVGVLPHDGPADLGEVALPTGDAARSAVERLAEEVKTEPLPPEHVEQLRSFHDLVLKGIASDGEGGDPEEP